MIHTNWIIQNQPVVIKFPCSKCGANQPTQYINETMQVGTCPCKVGKEVISDEV